MAIDFYDDTTGDILRLILEEKGAAVIPDYVRGDDALYPAEEIRQSKVAFAWPERKKFALDTRGDVWFSCMYFEKTASRIPFQHREAIRERIAKAADLFGVELPAEEVKVAMIPDEAFLVVHQVAGGHELAKRAHDAIEHDDQTVTLRLYPVHDREHAEKSAIWFPRDLSGELAGYRKKVANGLMQACERFALNAPLVLVDELAPIKLSTLLSHIEGRINILAEQDRRAQKAARYTAGAQARGVTLPYPMPDQPADQRLAAGYRELFKQAQADPLPAGFWEAFWRLDKLAGFDLRPDVMPVSALDRPICDDQRVKLCKVAGTFLPISQVIDKVPGETWSDIAPGLAGNLADRAKVASVVESLDDTSQRIILAKVRGF